MLEDNMKILITGAHGFLGHHVAKVFRDYRDGGADGLRRGIQVFTPIRSELDLMDDLGIKFALDRYKPDIVIHLAGSVGGIGLNKEEPGRLTYENLMMGLNLIEACRKHGSIKKFVCIGTTCSYSANCPIPFREDDFIEFNRNGPGMPEITNAGYGLGKRMLYEILRNYNLQYNFPFIYLIPVNMAGEHDNFNDDSSHVIPAMLKKFYRAKVMYLPSVTLWGDGSASREFLYAGDCAEAILRAVLVYNSPEPVNIGTGMEITIKELAEKIKTLVGYEGAIIWDASKPNGQPRRSLDVSRARESFGFMAQTNLDSMLQKTYKWAQENEVL